MLIIKEVIGIIGGSIMEKIIIIKILWDMWIIIMLLEIGWEDNIIIR